MERCTDRGSPALHPTSLDFEINGIAPASTRAASPFMSSLIMHGRRHRGYAREAEAVAATLAFRDGTPSNYSRFGRHS